MSCPMVWSSDILAVFVLKWWTQQLICSSQDMLFLMFYRRIPWWTWIVNISTRYIAAIAAMDWNQINKKKTELKCRLRKVWKVIKLTKSKVINQRNELYNNCHNIILIYCLYSAIISFLIYLLFSGLYKFNKTMTQSSTVCLLNFCILTGTYRICRS